MLVLAIIILLLSIALVAVSIYFSNNKKELEKRLTFFKSQNLNLSSEVDFLNISLKIAQSQLNKYEENQNTFSTPNGTIKKLNTFKGKKALIGDYSSSSYYNTKAVLLSLGFDIDIISNIQDIENAIRIGKHYDIIISNNYYPNGSGEKLIKNLKKIKDFNTPVVLHSATQDLYDFAMEVGFNGFLPKPIKQQDTIELFKKLIK